MIEHIDAEAKQRQMGSAEMTPLALFGMGAFLWAAGAAIVITTAIIDMRRPRRADRMWLIGGANVAGVALVTIGGVIFMIAAVKAI